jgi:cytidylate kinase
MNAHFEDVLADILARDERDSTRAVAPLREAADALHLDTSALDVEDAIAAALQLVDQRIESRQSAS